MMRKTCAKCAFHLTPDRVAECVDRGWRDECPHRAGITLFQPTPVVRETMEAMLARVSKKPARRSQGVRPPVTPSTVNMEEPGNGAGTRTPHRKKPMLTLVPPKATEPTGIDAAIAAGMSAFDGKITTAKDASDVIELTFNLAIAGKPAEFDPTLGPVRAAKVLATLTEMVKKLPSQNRLDEEAQRFQQFSTPPHLAYLVAWVANLEARDIVLEPSAGTGNIAAFALNAGCTVFCNEISHRRATLLRALPVARVFQENAEQIHNILDDRIAPTVVLMNPPFSVAGTRMEGQKVRAAGCLHVDQALLRLAEGGRLVAVIGDRRDGDDGTGRGMADIEWWNEVKSKYTVRASIGIPGREYSKFGTSFPTRVIVIDKCGPTPNGEPAEIGEAGDVAAAMATWLAPIRMLRDRTSVKPKPVETVMFGGLFGAIPVPAPKAAAKPVKTELVWPPFVAALPPDCVARLRAVVMDPSQKTWGDAHCITVRGNLLSTGQAIGNITLWQAVLEIDPAFPRSKPAGESWPRVPTSDLLRRAIGVTEQVVAPPSADILPERKIVADAVQMAAHATVANLKPLTDAIFEPYTPQRLFVTGAQPHPTPLVESAAMASVLPPEPKYAPCLPREMIDSGTLSLAQIEAVVYACQAHSQFLPTQRVKDEKGAEYDVDFRKGFFIGDGTGVGKGRELCAIILDHFARGGRKALWLTATPKLIKDAIRDWTDLGGMKEEIIPWGKVSVNGPIRANRGILFGTYGLLKFAKEGKSRLKQLVDWLGPDYDGVIAFDEAHNMKSALSIKKSRGHSKPSQTALVGCDLQRLLPKARVVYLSATGATEVANLAYCDRLGLYGRGTPFSTKMDFVSQIEHGGVAAMELVARDLKQRGLYMARGLSFGGHDGHPPVEYERLTHILSPEQRTMYDKLCEAWQIVLASFDEALAIVAAGPDGVDGRAKGAAYSAFWGAHQRFFNTILVAMQMPSVITNIEDRLAEGHCAVLQLVNTNEAMLERQLAKLDEDDDLGDIDMTPRDQLIQLVEHCFPVTEHEQYTDPSGNVRMRPVMDSKGNPVLNKEAVAMREALLIEVGSITCPDGPLEMLINHFGDDAVAEVTGRSQRVVRKVIDGVEKTVRQTRTPLRCVAETADFQDGKRLILIFSDAGGTGASYHADAKAANQRKRIHYLVQAGWVADRAVQGFGRTHRSNQVQPPKYMLVSTDLKGQKRFISTIARRLDQLGALTKGQRQAQQGLFTAADNLESEYARGALYQLYRDIHFGKVPGLSLEDFEKQTGLKLLDKEGNLKEELPPVTQFLNRLLSLQIEKQNALFDAYATRIEAKIRKAMLDGTFDLGVETIRADKASKVSEQVVYTDPASGAETKHVHIRLEHAVKPVTFDVLMKMENATQWQKIDFFARNIENGRVWAFTDAGDRTLKDGGVVPHYYQVGPTTRRPVPKHNIDNAARWTKMGTALPGQAERVRELWAVQVKEAPAFQEEDLHLITGAVLPIWDRLKGNPRVKRLATDQGERLLGRVVEEDDLADTLNRLGVNSEHARYTPARVVRMLLAGSHRFELANRWSLVRAKVKGKPRIEVVGPAFANFADLKVDGFYWERDESYKVHVYAPTETAEHTVASLLKTKPIAKAVRIRDVGEPDMAA